MRLERFTQVGTPYFEAQVTVHAREREAIDEALVSELADIATQLLDMIQASTSSSRSSKLPPSALSSLPLAPLKRLKSLLIDLDSYTADEMSDVLLATLLPSTTTSAGASVRPSSFPAKVHHLSLSSGTERVKHATHQLGMLKVELDSRQEVGDRYNAIQARKAREAVLRNIMEAVWQELRALKRQEADENGVNDPPSPTGARSGNGIRMIGRARPSGKGQGTQPAEEDEEDEEEEDDVATLSKKVAAVPGMSTDARSACKRELKRLKIIPPQSPEHGVLRNYLDWMCALPWGKSSYDNPDAKRIDRDFLNRARKQLDNDHFGLESVKERLLQYLAILRLRSEAHAEASAKDGQLTIEGPASAMSETTLVKADVKSQSPAIKAGKGLKDKGPILLLVGPPGVGKTSIARSLAAALGRPYHRSEQA